MTTTHKVQRNLGEILEVIAGDFLPERQRSGIPGNSSIGVILDDFSMQCFRPEGTLWPIANRDMEMALDRLNPEMMLIESAWNGNDGDWLYQITSPTGPKDAYYRLLKACGERSIPTVFWNKEDPPHFEQFLPAASAADYIFTCEESLVESYIKAAGHSNVRVMRFAAQPRLHVPFRSQESRSGNIAFAGQYFAHKFPERRQQMELLFPPATKLGFSIYSRALGGDPNYAFPTKYEKYIVGSLPYSDMVKAYRDHKVFLNVNSVPESKSMCARRIFELSSSKTAVVSVDTDAISSSYADDEVFTVTSARDASGILQTLVNDNDFRERATHRAWRRTLRDHTYETRLSEIRDQIMGAQESVALDISGICLVSSVDSLARMLNQISGQVVKPTEVIVVPMISAAFANEPRVEELLYASELRITILDSVDSLRRIDVRGDMVTIFSEAYDYSSQYLSDLALYTKHLVDPDVIGKALTGDHKKSSVDYLGNQWAEDIATDQFLSGAWISPSSCEWREMAFREIENPGGNVQIGRQVRVSDRFNIRQTSNSNSLSWIV